MAFNSTPPRKEGDTRWAQEYLLDPLNAVEAYQTAQTGGQYNNDIPTQHKTLSTQEYLATSSSGSAGLSRSRSLLSRSGSKKHKEGGRSQDKDKDKDRDIVPNTAAAGGLRRNTSLRDKLMRRFTDDGKDPDRRQRPLRPLNEVSNKEISRMGNTAPPRPPRILTPVTPPEKFPDLQNQQDQNDFQNQENRPVVKKAEDRWSNNPYREALIDAENRENRSPPMSPMHNISRSPTNPFRASYEPSTPPPVQREHRQPHHHHRPQHSQRSMPRNNGPRAAPPKRHSRTESRQKPVQRVLAADTIDSLDTSFGLFTFHHEGPYDATLSHRNRNPHRSPVQATRYGNEMALKATAPQDIQNSLQFGRPLDAVALFPPGTQIYGGDVLEYEEYDVNRKDGNFRRYPGEQYRDEDLKGKGIEGYDGDLAEKKRKEAKHRRGKSLDNSNNKAGDVTFAEPETITTVRRNGSTAGRLEGAAARIKRTFSIKRKERKPEDA
ncbi:hypothetical protein H072_1355 [Dactylellina haptotyla CBS 200.50]|uniref:Pal1 cell morphology protein n=1 Tax=Dactylellina haptotyla (strain CBS 200.50) TaxID=1284197 RepID=S8CAB0_DACHA|nr:hypothetical protein H072_1355 [Dactylellina haptotyla CBS 200.50]